MPAIWNVGNTHGYNDKKISSKLTFEEGETFKGRVVAQGDGESVVVKLTDGWQFPADLLEDSLGSAAKGQQLVQFKVEGFKDGKIKLKIINDLQEIKETVDDDVVKDFINKEGLSKEDFAILKAMIKFNIPLSKENIEFVKSVFNFSQKLENQSEIDDFINNYISGKGISPQSKEAVQIRDTLNEFFKAFKTMNQNDILLFLENDIDINTENIESYNKLFKSDITLNEYFDNVAKNFEELHLNKTGILNNVEVEENVGKEINPKNIEDNESIKYSQKQNMGLKVYDENTSSKSRVSLLNLLKTMTGTEITLARDVVKNILIENKSIFKGAELNEAFNKLDNISEEEIKNIFKEAVEDKGMTKEALNSTLNQLFGKEIKLSDNEVAKFKEILDFKMANAENTENTEIASKNQEQTTGKENNSIFKKEVQIQQNNESKNSEKAALRTEAKLTSSILVKHELNGKIENMKDVIRQLMSNSEELKSRTLEGKVAEFIKSNLNDFKLFNSLSNEYYYLDVPIDRRDTKYPCKLIIKDDRKGNKRIDSSNVKLVVAVKTVNMGTVDAYLTVSNNNLNVDIKCIDKYMKLLSKGTKQLTEKLSKLGYLVNITVGEKIDEVNLATCRKFFDSANTSALDIKV